jgi:hypothetical protein
VLFRSVHDLQALRERFADVNRERSEYQALLEKLVPKLQEAQRALQGLALNQPSKTSGEKAASEDKGMLETPQPAKSGKKSPRNKKTASLGSTL